MIYVIMMLPNTAIARYRTFPSEQYAHCTVLYRKEAELICATHNRIDKFHKHEVD